MKADAGSGCGGGLRSLLAGLWGSSFVYHFIPPGGFAPCSFFISPLTLSAPTHSPQSLAPSYSHLILIIPPIRTQGPRPRCLILPPNSLLLPGRTSLPCAPEPLKAARRSQHIHPDASDASSIMASFHASSVFNMAAIHRPGALLA